MKNDGMKVLRAVEEMKRAMQDSREEYPEVESRLASKYRLTTVQVDQLRSAYNRFQAG